MGKDTQLILQETIQRRIFLIRGGKVMLDSDLALLYGVTTFNFNKAVKRNIDRFPADFMFRLTNEDTHSLRFQIGMSKVKGRGGRRYLPYAFTEQGIAMLSSVLRSERAIRVNIEIMRAFVQIREILATHKDLARKLEELEMKYDAQFKIVFNAIRRLITPPKKPRRQIGFAVEEPIALYHVHRKRIKKKI